MVHFSTDLDPAQLPLLFNLMTGIVEWREWERRIHTLQSASARNPALRDYLRQRHELEQAFGDLRRYRSMTGRFPWPPRTAAEYRLCSFLAVAVRVHANLTEAGQKRLAGNIRGALKEEYGLGPVAFEMTVAASLMSMGFDVEFHDLEEGEGYDLLASRDGFEAEIECKHISADIGRQIHRRAAQDLGNALYFTEGHNLSPPTGHGIVLRVGLPGRLSVDTEQQKALVERILSVINGEAESVSDSVCTISAQTFELQNSPFSADRGSEVTMKDVEQYLSSAHGVEHQNILAHWSPGRKAVLVALESMKPDRVLDAMLDRLKSDAKRQFSGERAAVMCVHIADLTEQQLRQLADLDRTAPGTGLRHMAHLLLTKRPYLHSVAFMADGDVRITQQRHVGGRSTSVQEIGPSYVFSNPDHPMANVSVLEEMFRNRDEAA